MDYCDIVEGGKKLPESERLLKYTQNATALKKARNNLKDLQDTSKTFLADWIKSRTHEMELKKKFTEAVDFEQKQKNRKVTAESSLQQKVKYGVLGDISKESENEIVKSMSSKADLSSKEDKVECTENIDLNSVKVGRAYNNGKIMFTVLERHKESTVDQFMARHKTGLSKATLILLSFN